MSRRRPSITAPQIKDHPSKRSCCPLATGGTLALPKGAFRWKNRTVVMGILNVTPDSFSDGGRYQQVELALAKARQMQEQGADWIDIGGESTRPGAKSVTTTEEKKRILSVLKAFVRELKIPICVDTTKSEVARGAVGEGARMVNDISAMCFDPQMAGTIRRLKVPVVLMHMKGRPRTMQKNPRYRDVIGEVCTFLKRRVDFAVSHGIGRDRIVVDPGFGFGKTPAHNVELLRRLDEFKGLGLPLMMGLSRKATLGFLTGGLPPDQRLEATLSAVTISVLNGADWVRVHDVKEVVRAVKVADAVRYHRGLKD